MNLEESAIEILNLLCCNSGCVISDSGGKDSSVLKHIAVKAHERYGLPFKLQHNLTTVDAPETVYFVRSEQKKYMAARIEYKICYPQKSMWKLIIEKGTPPTRLMRYCCAELKEYSGKGEKVVTGVRKAESRSRKENQGVVTFVNPNKELKEKLKEKLKDNTDFVRNRHGGAILYNLDNADSRQLVETCYRTNKVLINPLIDWDDDFLWWYIRKEHIELNPLYECGFSRIGCIGCPMAGVRRYDEFVRYPKYRDAYVRAFDAMLKERERKGLPNYFKWRSGLSVFKWWMEDDNLDGQMRMDEWGNVFEEYSNDDTRFKGGLA